MVATLISGFFLVSVACSDQSPISPSAGPAVNGGAAAARAAAAAGVYDLSFNVIQAGTLQPVTTLPVSSQELILLAHVADAAGNPAQKGSVTFEYCSYKKGPPNQLSNPDEAPSSACADGSAAWARLGSRSIGFGGCPGLQPGEVCWPFGIVQIPRTVGFRFTYSSQGSGIATSTTAPEDFTWTE
jgi:hypothetical protein